MENVPRTVRVHSTLQNIFNTVFDAFALVRLELFVILRTVKGSCLYSVLRLCGCVIVARLWPQVLDTSGVRSRMIGSWLVSCFFASLGLNLHNWDNWCWSGTMLISSVPVCTQPKSNTWFCAFYYCLYYLITLITFIISVSTCGNHLKISYLYCTWRMIKNGTCGN